MVTMKDVEELLQEFRLGEEIEYTLNENDTLWDLCVLGAISDPTENKPA